MASYTQISSVSLSIPKFSEPRAAVCLPGDLFSALLTPSTSSPHCMQCEWPSLMARVRHERKCISICDGRGPVMRETLDSAEGS